MVHMEIPHAVPPVTELMPEDGITEVPRAFHMIVIQPDLTMNFSGIAVPAAADVTHPPAVGYGQFLIAHEPTVLFLTGRVLIHPFVK